MRWYYLLITPLHIAIFSQCENAATSFVVGEFRLHLSREPFVVVLPGIPPWHDQVIELFHGTIDSSIPNLIQGVDETIGSILKDFGRGFYTTTRFDKALEWANVKAVRAHDRAAVVRIDVARNDLAQLDCLYFIRGDSAAGDYWGFVQYCRTIPGDHNRIHKKWYDVVAGPVTGTWKKLTIIRDMDQISFHTPSAAAMLNASPMVRVV